MMGLSRYRSNLLVWISVWSVWWNQSKSINKNLNKKEQISKHCHLIGVSILFVHVLTRRFDLFYSNMMDEYLQIHPKSENSYTNCFQRSGERQNLPLSPLFPLEVNFVDALAGNFWGVAPWPPPPRIGSFRPSVPLCLWRWVLSRSAPSYVCCFVAPLSEVLPSINLSEADYKSAKST